ncbi:MAG TPA: NlpC/P60 family protein [Gaiellales bacterium]|nr:NlpC/P60 family protein [Gaiellales bacterium]
MAATLRARLVGSACAAVLATSALAVTPQAYADHGGGGPSAGQVAASKARVARLERKVAAAADAVTRAQQSLDAARTAAEVAVEAFDKARVRQAASVHALAAAQLVLDAAGARVASARRDVGQFAAAAYEGGTLSSLDVVLNSKGPDAMLYRLSALDAVSRSQRDVLQTMDAAQVYQRAVQQQAAAVVAESRRATTAADAARVHAAQLVAAQTAAVTRVSAASDHLGALLADARAHASALERARLQALADARARALAAKRAAALRAAQERANQQAQNGQQAQGGQGSGQQSGGQDFGATVSAATERDALAAAESQLGKPYEWGAAGPDTYDCSGLVMWAYAQVGVHVDHWTGDQWNEGAHIPVSALREGDLLFFATDTSDPNTIHHVGMYVGNGQMIEAPYTGANVRYSDAFRPDLIGAVRFFNR